MKTALKMYILAVFICIVLPHAFGQFQLSERPHVHPFKVGYYVKDKLRQQVFEVRDPTEEFAGRYGFDDTRGRSQHMNYAVDRVGLRTRVHTIDPEAVYSPLQTSGADPVPAYYNGIDEYDDDDGYGYNGYGYNGYGYNGYGYNGYGNGYGGGLGYSGILGNYRSFNA